MRVNASHLRSLQTLQKTDGADSNDRWLAAVKSAGREDMQMKVDEPRRWKPHVTCAGAACGRRPTGPGGKPDAVATAYFDASAPAWAVRIPT